MFDRDACLGLLLPVVFRLGLGLWYRLCDVVGLPVDIATAGFNKHVLDCISDKVAARSWCGQLTSRYTTLPFLNISGSLL